MLRRFFRFLLRLVVLLLVVAIIAGAIYVVFANPQIDSATITEEIGLDE